MIRILAVLAGAVLLAGCPIPQPVPDYPPGSITPPRILMDQVPGANQTLLFVPAGCTGAHPTVPLSATLDDPNTLELVQARWFVNYDANNSARYDIEGESDIPGTTGPTTRAVPSWTFDPYATYGTVLDPLGSGSTAGALQVVELVVSNGFDSATDVPFPNRTPKPKFETQVYKWIFYTVTPGGSVTCPP